jgi:hypothetical protein
VESHHVRLKPGKRRTRIALSEDPGMGPTLTLPDRCVD